MVSPLGGPIGDLIAPTTYVGDVNSRPPRSHCRSPGSTQQLCQRCRWKAPWEAFLETREHSPTMLETSVACLLGGGAGGPGALMVDTKNVNGGSLGGGASGPGAPTINAKKRQQRAPSEVVPVVREHPPSTLKNIDGGPPGKAVPEVWDHPPLNSETSMMGPQDPLCGLDSICCPRLCCDLYRQHR
jgi:hypothetical protein